jgi:hypothetical protein
MAFLFLFLFIVKIEIYIEIEDRHYNYGNLYNIIMKNNNNKLIINNNKPIIIPSKIYLTYPNLHNLRNIAKWKDQRLELVEIPKGLFEILQNAGFTMEKILDSEPSEIAEKLGIDSYIGEIIFKETKKAISKTDPDLLLIN